MTEQYKIGDKVLVEAEITHIYPIKGMCVKILCSTPDYEGKANFKSYDTIRPYTPRQEFENGEEVEVRHSNFCEWVRAKYIGFSHHQMPAHEHQTSQHVVNLYDKYGNFTDISRYYQCRKFIAKPRETITIGGTTYDKAEFENAVKDLKPIGEVK